MAPLHRPPTRPTSQRSTPGAPGEASSRDVYSVSRLNKEVSQLLEHGMPSIWLEGELSNFARPASGHWYFSLKDRDAQVRCAMFRQRNARVAVIPQEGQRVLVRARVSLYEPRGDFQLMIEHLEEAGIGALRREFELLKARLAAEGLFDEQRKRTLPPVPQTIGVVTSPTGAALRDILQILKRRYPMAAVVIYPSAVQGKAAVPELLGALERAASRAECDVLIVARGGGSLEDLWAFNDEALARRLASMPMPVVTGVGHEIDFTIADFVADLRAPTPSGAAELVSPDTSAWHLGLARLHRRLNTLIAQTLQGHALAVRSLQQRLTLLHPGNRLRQNAQRLDELDQRLRQHWAHTSRARRQRLLAASRTLHAVSPLATLDRGYAILTKDTEQVIRDVREVKIGDIIEARVAKGRLKASVSAIEPAAEE
jgi:exodeoxyribonuclease VII large subunit